MWLDQRGCFKLYLYYSRASCNEIFHGDLKRVTEEKLLLQVGALGDQIS